MGKRMRIFKGKIAAILVSLFVLLAVSLPVYATGRWIYDIAGNHDPRKVVPAAEFVARKIDATKAPLRPFQEPIVSITFDDGRESVYTQAFPILQAEGFHTTQYIIAGTLDDYNYLSMPQLKAMHNTGTEIGSHTMTHPDLTTLTTKDLNWELGESKYILSQQLGPIYDFASPLGAYNNYVLGVVKKYYQSHKNAEGDPNANPLTAVITADTFNPYDLKSYTIRSTTTLNDLKKLIHDTELTNGWLILTYHQVEKNLQSNDNDAVYGITPQTLKQQLDLVSASPLRSATVHQVLSSIDEASK